MDPIEDSGAEVQPDGQGPESTETSGLEQFYDLSTIPEDQRQYIEPILKEAQSNFNKKVEQVNGQWKPYADLGVNQIDPDLMEELVTIAQIADDDQALQNWWTELGNERGWAQQVQEFDDEEYDDEEDITPEDLQQFQDAIQQAIDQRTAPLYEAEAAREQEQRVAEADTKIGQQLDALKKQYGDFNEQAVCKLALGYDGEDAIQKGFEEYRNLIQSAENGVFEGAGNQPASPEGPGNADTSAQPITSFEEAKAAARERMIQANKT